MILLYNFNNKQRKYGIAPPNELSHFGETEIEPSPYSLFGQPPTAAKSLRSMLRHDPVQLCQFLIPHLPHVFVHFVLKSYQVDRINIIFHKNAKKHLKPIDIPLWVWYSIDTLKHTKRLGLI